MAVCTADDTSGRSQTAASSCELVGSAAAAAAAPPPLCSGCPATATHTFGWRELTLRRRCSVGGGGDGGAHGPSTGSNRLQPMSAAVRSSVPAVKYDDRFVHTRFGSGGAAGLSARSTEQKRPNSARPAAREGFIFGTLRPASAGSRPSFPGGVSISQPAWQ